MLNLYAPGVQVNTSSGVSNTSYTGASLSGTSLAAPHVAGAWALAKHAWSAAPVDDLLTAFETTGVPVVPTHCTSSDDAPRIQIDDAILSCRAIFFIQPPELAVLDILDDIWIDWEPRAILGNVKIEIQSPDKSIECSKSTSMVIEDSYPADGAPYYWRIPKCFYTGQYRLVFSQGSDVWQSGAFTVGGLTITGPQSGELYRTGQLLKISWTNHGLKYGTLDIHLKSTDEFNKTIYTIVQDLPYDQEFFSWTIPGTVQPDDYVVEITLDRIVRRSGAFNIQ
jgi:hypothetical protein